MIIRSELPYKRQIKKSLSKTLNHTKLKNKTNSNQNNEDQIWYNNKMKENNEGLNWNLKKI